MAGLKPLLAVDDVIERLLASATPISECIEIPVAACMGSVLAADVTSGVDVPSAANSSMDGYAVNTAQVSSGHAYGVSQRIPAGRAGKPLEPGTIARIFTGAPIPDGADAVVMQEDTSPVDEMIRINSDPRPGENVRPCGQDIGNGDVILSAGRRLLSQDAALLSSVGKASVSVRRPLRIAILSTGDELVDPPGELHPGQIYNANHYGLIGLIESLGMQVIDLGLVGDDAAATRRALLKGAGHADCIISSGGVSVGDEDHVKGVVEELGELSLWRIAIKPGKPLAFGHIQQVPFFGLPGNPVSTFVTFTVIARPYLLKYQGNSEVMPQAVYARADFDWSSRTRREYLRVRITYEKNGQATLTAYPNQGSGVMSSVSWANALAQVEIGQTVTPGDLLKTYLL